MIVWLVPGFLLLWSLGGIAIYTMFRGSEIGRVDAKLSEAGRSASQMLASEVSDDTVGRGRGPRRHNVRLPEFDDSRSGYFYQVFHDDGTIVEKSPLLESRDLPNLGAGAGRAEKPITIMMPDGEKLRAMWITRNQNTRGGPWRGRAQPTRMTAVVAISLSETNRSLAGLATGLAIAGIAGAALAAIWIAMVMRDVLKPLDRLGRELGKVTPDCLSTRLGREKVPDEIRPVVDHVNELLDRLEAAFHRERRFNADLAHELRTPLAEIRSLVELGLRFPDEMGERQQREILGASERMGRMVESMLLLAKCEGTALADEGSELSLEALVNECRNAIQADAERREVTFGIDFPPGATVRGNGNLWRHLLGNLLSNSVDHSPERSHVRITAGNGNLLEITNSAPGLLEEDLGHMFSRLWRADAARSGDHHCGLGLSIAMACALALGVRLGAVLHTNGELTMRVWKKSS